MLATPISVDLEKMRKINVKPTIKTAATTAQPGQFERYLSLG